MATFDQLSKQRIDYQDLGGGRVKAILTVTLPGGITRRFEETFDPSEVAGLFSGLGRFAKKAGKSIGHVAHKLATSKVLALAAAGLALAVPGVGPALAAGIAAASGVFAVTSKLVHASAAAHLGAHDHAKHIAAGAVLHAQGRTRSEAASKDLLAIANEKRKKVDALTASAPSSSPRAAPARTLPAARPDVLTAAEQGKLRSNRPGPVTRNDLLAAHEQGRVFWVIA